MLEKLIEKMCFSIKISFINESASSNIFVIILIGLSIHSKKHNSQIYSVNKMMILRNERRACDLIYSHDNRIIIFELKDNTTHIQDSFKYINDRGYPFFLVNYLRSTEPHQIEGKIKLGRIGIEFHGENNDYKVKIRIGEDLNINEIETIRQITNNKIIKRKMIQTRKNNNNKKKALKNLNSNKKSFFDGLI